MDTDTKTNVVVAVFTTMYARMKLHKEVLAKLQERALYCDTDSVAFLYDPDGWNPPKGVYLGQLTLVLNAGEHIVEFASGGPKNYTCKVVNSSTGKHVYNVTKVHGLTIKKLGAKKLVNHDKIVDLVLPKEQMRSNGLSGKKIQVPFFYIARDDSFNLHSRVVKKVTLLCLTNEF